MLSTHIRLDSFDAKIAEEIFKCFNQKWYFDWISSMFVHKGPFDNPDNKGRRIDID